MVRDTLYDLWWPPLLVWVSACFLDSAITILGVNEHRVRVAPSSGLAHRPLFGGAAPGILRRPDIRTSVDRVPAAAFAWASRSWCCWVRAAPRRRWVAWRWLVSAPPRVRLAAGRAWQQIVVEGWEDELEMVAGPWPHVPGACSVCWRWRRSPGPSSTSSTSAASPTSPRSSSSRWTSTCLAEVTAEGPLRAFVGGQHAPGGLRRAREPAVPPGNGVVDAPRLAHRSTPSRRGRLLGLLRRVC